MPGIRLQTVRRREILQQTGIFGVLIVLGIVFGILSPYFWTAIDMSDIGQAVAPILIVSLGMTFVMIAGEIDISVGGIFCVASTILVTMLEHGMPALVAVVITILAGAAYGTLNGIIVVKGHVSSLLVTLGGMTLLEGLAVALSEELTIPITNNGLTTALGTGSVLGIPNPVVVTLAVLAVSWVVLSKAKFGWDVYATGGGREAARLAGVATGRVRISVLAISGACAAFGGVVLSAQLSAGVPTGGVGMELARSLPS